MSAHFDVAALKAKTLPRCRWSSIFTAQDDEAAADAAKHLDAYLAAFVIPTSDFACVGCGLKLMGFMGTFGWGLAHGEGACGNCGYPTRMLHRFADGPVQRLTMPLQYHPDEFTDAPAAASEAP